MGRRNCEKWAKMVDPNGVATRTRARRSNQPVQRQNEEPEFVDLTASSPIAQPSSPQASPPPVPTPFSHLLPFPPPRLPAPTGPPTDAQMWYHLHRRAGLHPAFIPPCPENPFPPVSPSPTPSPSSSPSPPNPSSPNISVPNPFPTPPQRPASLYTLQPLPPPPGFERFPPGSFPPCPNPLSSANRRVRPSTSAPPLPHETEAARRERRNRATAHQAVEDMTPLQLEAFLLVHFNSPSPPP